MRTLRLAFAAPVAVSALWALLWAGGGGCGGDNSSTPPDASDAPTDTVLPMRGDEVSLPVPDAGVKQCTLSGGNDPVGLCVQKTVLQTVHQAAFNARTGVAASFDSTTFQPGSADGGAPVHDLHDDIGYGAAIALYHTSSSTYGDNELTPTLDADIVALVPFVLAELQTLPSEYSGELYAHLRGYAIGLRYVNDTMDADKVDAIADAYGRAIYTNYYFPLAATALDAGAGDAAVGDGGVDSDGIFGFAVGGRPGVYAYATADVATAAFALIDMAVRHPMAPEQALWQAAAITALSHIDGRARDSTTGMYYRNLVTGTDPGHDALDATQPPADGLFADVQALVALTELRALDLVDAHQVALAVVAKYPFRTNAAAVVARMNGTPSLYDGTADAGAMPTGILEGYVPSVQGLLSTKTTRSNVFTLAALHRLNLIAGAAYSYEINPLRAVLLKATTSNASLFTVAPNQVAYFRAASRDFHFALANSLLGGSPEAGVEGGVDGGLERGATSYSTKAAIDFVEGMTENMWGLP